MTSSSETPIQDEIQYALDDIEVYPNPFEHQLTIEYNNAKAGNYSVKLYNVVGKLVYREPLYLTEGKSQFRLSLPDLKEGIYMLQISNGRNSNAFKLIKRWSPFGIYEAEN